MIKNFFKKLSTTTLLMLAGALVFGATVASATILPVGQGGTGWGNPGGLSSGTVLLGNGLSGVATTTAATNGQILQFNGATWVPANVSSVAAFPFTPTNYGNATSTTLGFLNGFLSTASSTINAPFRLPSISDGCLNVASGLVGAAPCGSVFPFTPTTNFGTNVNSTSTPISFTQGIMASSTSYFDTIYPKQMDTIVYAAQYNGSDMCAKANNAYAAGPSTGLWIIAPAGSYTCATALAFTTSNKPVIFQGSGSNATTFTMTMQGTTTTFRTGQQADASSGIRDMTIQGTSTDDIAPGIEFGGGGGSWAYGFVQNVHVTKLGIGIYLGTNTYIVNLDHVISDFNQQAFVQGTGSNQGEQISVTNSLFADNRYSAANPYDHCFNIIPKPTQGAPSINVINTSFDKCQVYVGNEATVNIIGGHMEQLSNSGTGYTFLAIDGDSNSSTHVYGTRFENGNNAGHSPACFVTVATGASVTITDSSVGQYGGYTIPTFLCNTSTGTRSITNVLNVAGDAFTTLQTTTESGGNFDVNTLLGQSFGLGTTTCTTILCLQGSFPQIKLGNGGTNGGYVDIGILNDGNAAGGRKLAICPPGSSLLCFAYIKLTNGAVGFGTSSPWGYFSVDTSDVTSGGPKLTIGSTTDQSLILDYTNHLGVGTFFPSAAVHASSTDSFQYCASNGQATSNQTWCWGVGDGNSNVGNGNWGLNILGNGSGTALEVSAGARVGISTSSPFAHLAVHANSNDPYTRFAFLVGSSTQTATSTLFAVASTGSTTLASTFGSCSGGSALTTNTGGTIVCGAITGITAASSTLLGDSNTFSGTNKFNNPITDGTLSGLIGGNSGLTYAVATGTVAAGPGISVTGGQSVVGSGLTITNLIGYEFPNNATTTGLGVYASTTIGSGTAITGLTVSGGATTTGNSILQGNVSIGSSTNTGTIPLDFKPQISTSGTLQTLIHLNYSGAGGTAGDGVTINGPDNTARLGFVAQSGYKMVFYTNSQEQMRLGSNGNLGLGTTTPLAKLAVSTNVNDTAGQPLFMVSSSTSNSTTTLFRILNDGTIYAPNTGTGGGVQTGTWCYDALGQFFRDTAVCAVSDPRAKNIEGSFTSALDEIDNINPIIFKYKPEFNGPVFQNDPNYNGDQLGFSAKDLQAVDAKLVDVYTKDGSNGLFDYKAGEASGVRPIALATLALAGVKELNDRITTPVTKSIQDTPQDAALVLIIGYLIYDKWNRKKSS